MLSVTSSAVGFLYLHAIVCTPLLTIISCVVDWFAVHAAWTAEAGVDISICLNKYKKHYKDGEKEKIREVVLTVRDDVRIDQDQADSLFKVVKEALENNDAGIDLEPWHRVDELANRQMVWTHKSGAGRKVFRPIVEDAVKGWD